MNSTTSLGKAAQDLVEARLLSGAAVCFHVSTTSMLPTLRPGDALTVEQVAAAEVDPGALVVLRQENAWIVHRLIRREASGSGVDLLTKGDNRLRADPVSDAAALVGRVRNIQRGQQTIDLFTWRARYGGRALAWLSWTQASWSAPAPGRFRDWILEGMRRGIMILSRLVYAH